MSIEVPRLWFKVRFPEVKEELKGTAVALGKTKEFRNHQKSNTLLINEVFNHW